MTDAFKKMMWRLNTLDIEEPWELLINLPQYYDDFTVPLKSIPAVMRLDLGATFYAALKLVSVKHSDTIRAEKLAKGMDAPEPKREYMRIDLSDGMRSMSVFTFSKLKEWEYAQNGSIGQIIHVSGKVTLDKRDDSKTLGNLELVPVGDRNRIVARYRGKPGVIQPSKVAELTKIAALNYPLEAVEHMLDELGVDEMTVLAHCRIPFNSLKHLLTTLHNPRLPDDLDKAMLSARRLNAYYGIRKAMAATKRAPNPEAAMPIDRALIKALVEQHPFTPTPDQRRAIWDIIQDFSLETPMDRLLSADVGNGKTMAYGIPSAYACSLGKNVVIMLPTEPLADQVAKNIRTWYPQLNIHLVTAGFNAEVTQGSILIGTTAILSWLKKNPQWKVFFAVTDEQQKMGTVQRESISSLGTHVLEATATPIPRTMAQTMFGNKKITVIKDCPVKKTIRTQLIGNTIPEKRVVMDLLYKRVAAGDRVALIYPLVAEQKAFFYHVKCDDLKEAEKICAVLKKKSGFSVKNLTVHSESSEMLAGIDRTISEGYVVELHGEDDAHNRLTKRFMQKLGEVAVSLEYLGAQVDEDLTLRNQKTILQGAAKWEKLKPNRVAVIHGRSKRDEKTTIIDLMNAGGADVLLATTLIEIGVDIANLRALGVIDADHLGAFTLHQLRGRVARNGGEGDFCMIASSPLEELDPVALNRLNLLVKYTSGDDIALYDMEQRGFGNLAMGGKSQKGFENGLFPQLKLSPSELDQFLREMERDLRQAKTQTAAAIAP
jgi:ATP-dependent DNA helicase RecG